MIGENIIKFKSCKKKLRTSSKRVEKEESCITDNSDKSESVISMQLSDGYGTMNAERESTRRRSSAVLSHVRLGKRETKFKSEKNEAIPFINETEVNTSNYYTSEQKSAMFVDPNDLQDLGQMSTQSSVQIQVNLSTQVSSFCSKSDEDKRTRKHSYIKSFTKDELDDQYNIDKFIQFNHDDLQMKRNPHYIFNHKYIDVRMRVILLDWIMEVCGQLGFRRSTYHSSVVLVDLFLSRIENLQTNQLQLAGVTCLFISAKNEEIVIPSIDAFSHATDYAYSTKEILQYEKYILQWLQWKIQYPSLCFWANYITSKWDEFALDFGKAHGSNFCRAFRSSNSLPQFRNQTSEEYYLFRNFYQIIDAISLDYDYMKFSEKILAVATVYLLIGLYLKFFNIPRVVNEFAFDCNAYSSFYDLNIIFNRFLCNYLDCELDDVVEHIQYVSCFFSIRFEYNDPVIIKKEEYENFSHEDFLQTQTHNVHNIKSLEHIMVFKATRLNNSQSQ